MSGAHEFWVVVEHWKGEIRPVTREVLGRARALADAASGRVVGVIMARDAQALVPRLAGLGVDQALCLSSEELGRCRARPFVEAAAAAVRRRSPFAVLVGATMNGREFAASLAAALEAGIASDCTSIEWTEGKLVATRPVF